MMTKVYKYCKRCTWDMWFDVETGRWYCTNPHCVKYKPQPAEEPAEEPQQEAGE